MAVAVLAALGLGAVNEAVGFVYGLLQRVILLTALAWAGRHGPTQPGSRPNADLPTPSPWTPASLRR